MITIRPVYLTQEKIIQNDPGPAVNFVKPIEGLRIDYVIGHQPIFPGSRFTVHAKTPLVDGGKAG